MRARSRLLSAVLSLLAGCTSTGQYIHYDAQRNIISAKPPYIATGDSLFLVVHDTLYRNLYASKTGTADVVVAQRAAMIGAIDIPKIADAFPAQVFRVPQPKAAAPTEAPQPAFLQWDPSATKGFFLNAPKGAAERIGALRDQLEDLIAERDTLIADVCEDAIDEASAYFLTRPDQSALLAFIADPGVWRRARMLAGRDSTGRYGNVNAPDLAQLVDSLAHHSLSPQEADTLLARARRYARESVAFSLLLGVEPGTFAPDPTDLQKQLGALQKCLDARSGLSPDLREAQKQIAALGDSLRKAIARAPDAGGAQSIPVAAVLARVPLPAFDPLIIAGVNVEQVVRPTRATVDAIRALYSDLAVIARTSRQVGAALNLAPQYATRCVPPNKPAAGGADSGAAARRMDEDRRAGLFTHPVCGDVTRAKRIAQADTIFIGKFWQPTQVQVTPARGDRFPQFVAPPTVTFAQAGKPAAQTGRPGGDSGSTESRRDAGTASLWSNDGSAGRDQAAGNDGGGKKKTEQDVQDPKTNADDDKKKKADDENDDSKDKKPAKPEGDKPKDPTVPTAAVDVLERYRFQLGLGYGRSSLSTFKYETKADTIAGKPGTLVTATDVSPNQNLPVVTLSYMLLPLRGKVFGGQAYELYDGTFLGTLARYVRQAGLAVQLGLALDHPTEQLFAGVATEPLPGLTIGYGQFLTYVDRSAFASGTFVPLTTDPTPVRKRWVSEMSAWTFSLDAEVIVAAFGKLLSLK